MICYDDDGLCGFVRESRSATRSAWLMLFGGCSLLFGCSVLWVRIIVVVSRLFKDTTEATRTDRRREWRPPFLPLPQSVTQQRTGWSRAISNSHFPSGMAPYVPWPERKNTERHTATNWVECSPSQPDALSGAKQSPSSLQVPISSEEEEKGEKGSIPRRNVRCGQSRAISDLHLLSRA